MAHLQGCTSFKQELLFKGITRFFIVLNVRHTNLILYYKIISHFIYLQLHIKSFSLIYTNIKTLG